MKGLLLKDWYMMKKYCKAYLVIAVAFLAVSFTGDNNLFFIAYPCLLCGMIPVNLLGYDERSRWLQYSGTMPYTKAQIVSSKYLIGLLTQLAMLTATAVAQIVKTLLSGVGSFGELTTLMLMVLVISTMSSAIPLPLIFKLGAEKGRIAYYVMIGFVCGASALASGLVQSQKPVNLKPNLLLALTAAAGIGIYLLSWYLSILFFRKREIR